MKIVQLIWLPMAFWIAACSQSTDNKATSGSEILETNKPEPEEVKIENLLRDTLEITEV
ncbi:hypothetical protein QWY93_01370 [Echinicola jeungdonensis]|uniref:Uncharacterized protein n=1 Tax=Echinicola jeungdonensis TaxID=709343 RepID=A0ABV5J4L3_9BACT|nr:hypothetical protein [Echinicola jeungdonensis]MDN3667992.1 hypothetical protein [Echinicola jeungdonensis]